MTTASNGQRLFYALEAPEVWFEDFGHGQLADGEARINLDPIFLESVTNGETHPMLVFVTMTDPSLPVCIEQGRDHFVVHELPGRAAGAPGGHAGFNWRVVAKRRGLETLRLEVPEDEIAIRAAMARQRAPEPGIDPAERGTARTAGSRP